MSEKFIPTISLSFDVIDFPIGGPIMSLSAVVTGQGPLPTGVLTFQAGGMVMGNANIREDGTARLKYSGFKAGLLKIKAVYAGDDNYERSESPSLDFTSEKATYKEPALPTSYPQPQKGPPVSTKKHEVRLRVNLAANTNAILPCDKNTIEFLACNRTINIAGVGTNLKHGFEFSLRADEATRVLKGYSEFVELC